MAGEEVLLLLDQHAEIRLHGADAGRVGGVSRRSCLLRGKRRNHDSAGDQDRCQSAVHVKTSAEIRGIGMLPGTIG
jgi:hypothetical protein